MKHIPQISEAEYEVMKVIWKYAPISTNDITDKLLQTTSWNPRTIQTLIKRLSDKSAISYEKKAACSSTPLSSVRRNIENMKAHLF